jgi:hypothetical protein
MIQRSPVNLSAHTCATCLTRRNTNRCHFLCQRSAITRPKSASSEARDRQLVCRSALTNRILGSSRSGSDCLEVQLRQVDDVSAVRTDVDTLPRLPIPPKCVSCTHGLLRANNQAPKPSASTKRFLGSSLTDCAIVGGFSTSR